MTQNNSASGEAKRIRRREAIQNNIAKCILACCGIINLALVIRYTVSGSAEHTPFGICIMILGCLFYICSFSNLLTSYWTIGMAPPAVLGTLITSYAALSDIIGSRGNPLRIPIIIILSAISLLAAIFIAICIAIFAGSLNPVRNGEPVTVVVLGCRLRGNKPGRMLKRRLDAAVRFLNSHPNVPCIVSGGRGDDEEAAEADVMKAYLIKQGLSADRIYAEDRSATTYENIRFSKVIADRSVLPACFAICTDRFHQLRSRLICRDHGISCRCINAETAPHLTLQFWSREVMCLIEKFIKRL